MKSRLFSTTASLRNSLRNSTTTTSPTHTKSSNVKRYDTTLIKPVLVVLFFGSVLSAVTDQQRNVSELKRRYNLKLDILNNLLTRIKAHNDYNFDLAKELFLVDKLFTRSNNWNSIIDKTPSTTNDYSSKTILDSLNGSTNTDQSLDDLWNSIINEVNTTTTTAVTTRVTAEPTVVQSTPPVTPPTQTQPDVSTKISKFL
ncbi:hypothetical protein Kpol_1073p2 [Vanderwaltozyma polyspora DSM 70294]|uniref:Uncharacterized protein n=1 Tax=Vanderwaltozyma polyspora (strain ATCC 22028 / DSM 70294 / BCRC 21397 / CBS 2163 / NBRC 10782 / NRRL Y-8283 / UCD 57-17) TaxID=436907 RepID=A7TPR5_VANPO|nr:uncharacterized protein Kpol_1073p2 [Vanderwaltozyma polyspora DSM 70294]EDO15716.1 hypothetical protein Kpol_1073p2 [Vanderwaltozyma polyspora DSM 70294]